MKKVKRLLVCLIALLMLTSNVLAAEVGPGYVYRWFDVRYNEDTLQNYCYLQLYGGYLDYPYDGRYSSAVSHWTNYSEGWVQYVNSSFSNSNVDLATHASWPVEYGDLVAVTLVYDVDGNCAISGDFNSGTITYAQIYTNPDYDYTVNTNFKVDYVLRHEMGHVLGMGHPYETASIMHAYLSSTEWSTIQVDDINTLEGFYE